jgi:predicted 2-oxoglutarate/Fe(II)-dependent dioxygenase YbiX
VGWLESLVRRSESRAGLRDVRKVIESVGQTDSDSADVIILRRIYAQLLRMWAET